MTTRHHFSLGTTAGTNQTTTKGKTAMNKIQNIIRARRINSGEGVREDKGFTLIEILIAIVLVGVLSAVVVVGISSLTDKGSDSACEASLDAAKAGSVVYYTTEGKYPTTFEELTAGDNPALVLPSGVEPDGTKVVNGDWTLTLTPNESKAPTFTCSDTADDA